MEVGCVVCVLIRDVQLYSCILFWAFEAVISCFQYACIGKKRGRHRSRLHSLALRFNFISILFQ